MSSIKRHLPHFGNNSNHPQKQLLANDFLVSCLTTNDRGVHPSGSSQPTMPSRAYTSKKSTASSDSRSFPSNAPPQINDAACLRQSIDECLNICSSYIQALNTVCSTGTLLAQSLTEVFSRDLSATQSNCENSYSLPKSKKSFLGLKSTTGSHVQDVTKESDVLPISDFDQVYYDMAEQFLRVFEILSVSTAGVSANLKTETLMSLQEVMNCLDASETIPTDRKRGSDRRINLEKSIQAAKACLLSYIELQTQYSYASWKSLNHLSKALQMDCNMSDIVTNIRQHYNFDSVAKKHLSNAIPTSSGLTACSQQKDLEETDRKEKSGPDLSKAMELLSLNPTSKKGKSRKNLKHLKITCKQSDDRTLERKNQPQGNEPHSEVILDEFLSKNQTSTWPGKTTTSPVTEDQNKSSKTLSADAWSLWTSKTPSFATCATNPWIGQSSGKNPNDPATSWDLFLPRGVLSTSQESPHSAGSTSSNNTSMGTLSSNSSSYGGSSFDPFHHITHTQTNMLYNNNDGELVNCGIARDSVDYRGTPILDGSFGNYLDTCRSSTSTTTYSSVNPITKSSFGSQGINLNTATVNDLISLLGDNTSSVFPVVPSPQSTATLKSGSHDLSSSFVQSAVPSDIRTAKTSTWPLKETQSLTSGASTSSGQGLANWPNSLVFDGLSQPFSSDVNFSLGGNDSSKWSFQESKMVIGNDATPHFTPMRSQQNFLPQQQITRNVGQSSFSLLESNNNTACPPRNKNF